MASCSLMVFDKPNLNIFLGISFIFLAVCAPLSIPVSVYLIWSRYCRGDYKKTRLFCALPIIAFGVVYGILEALSSL